MSKIIDAVKQDLDSREAKGLETYGTTLDRQDLTEGEWLNHLYEELLDAVCYIKKMHYETTRKTQEDDHR